MHARHQRRAQVRYSLALLKKFRFTFALAATILLGGGLLVHAVYEHAGQRLSLGESFGAVYFTLIGNPNVPWPDPVGLQIFFFLLPPLGLVVFADGVVRFGYVFFAQRQNQREWLNVLASTFKDHVVVVGMGQIGWRVLTRLRAMDVDVVAIEANEHGPFVKRVQALDRADDHMVLFIEDARAEGILRDAGVERARALIACTDNDLINIDVALHARELNPSLKLVCRLFDDELAKRIQSFGIHAAYSSSQLAAPSFALAALDTGVIHSFTLPGENEVQVVGELQLNGPLAGKSVRDFAHAHHIFVLRMQREKGTPFEGVPHADEPLAEGDRLVVQGGLSAFRALASAVGA
jgi:Trk K+ transport system NAD-binding subunit